MIRHPDWSKMRVEFPTFRRKSYLNSCSLGLPSRRVRAAIDRYMDIWMELGAAAWFDSWVPEIAALKREFARLIGADADEIAILPNVTSALAAISSSLDFTKRNRVVTCALDFPTLAHHFLAKKRLGVETVILPSTDGLTVEAASFERAVSTQTALVATSRVYFTSGYIQDIASIAEIAHGNGALVLVDDYQGTGQLPIDVRSEHVDILVSGGLKWLLGGSGIAYLYVRRDLIGRLEPTVAGWFGSRHQFDFDPHQLVFKHDAARFEAGTPAAAAVFAGAAGLRIINELGSTAIRDRTVELTAYLVDRLKEQGFKLRIPLDPSYHASITLVEMEEPQAMVRALAERDIIVDHRPGAVRISPYFYNTKEDVDAVVAAMGEIRDGKPG